MSDSNERRSVWQEGARQESARPESTQTSGRTGGVSRANTSRYAQAMDNLRFTVDQKEELKRSLSARLREDVAREESAHGEAMQGEAEPHEAGAPKTPAQGRPAGLAGQQTATHAKRSRISRRRFVGLLAAAGLTAGAAGLAIATGLARVNANDAAGDLFPQGPTDGDIVARIGRTVGLSQTCNGVTVSLDSILGDKNNVAIVFSVYRDDGSELGCAPDPTTGEPVLVSMMSGITLISTEAGMGGVAYSYDADPADNAMQYVCLSGSETPLVGERAHITIGDLLTYDEAGFRTIARGTWKFDVTLDYEDTSRELAANHAPVSRSGIDATIERVLLSPIGLTVELAASDASQWHEDGVVTARNLDEQQDFMNMPLALVMSEGEVREVGISSSSASGIGVAQEPDGETSVLEPGPILLIAHFDRIIDPDDVTAVRVGDVEISVA